MSLIKEEENGTKRFIQHNLYFIAWLKVVKNVAVEETVKKNGFFILGLTKKEYDAFKVEYKVTHKDVLKNINVKVIELENAYKK